MNNLVLHLTIHGTILLRRTFIFFNLIKDNNRFLFYLFIIIYAVIDSLLSHFLHSTSYWSSMLCNCKNMYCRKMYHRRQNKCHPQRCQIVSKTAVKCSTLQWNLTAVTNLTFVILRWHTPFYLPSPVNVQILPTTPY